MSQFQVALNLIIAGVLCILPAITLRAQNFEPEAVSSNVIERIEEESGGDIELDIPDSILEKLLSRPSATKKNNSGNSLNRRPSVNKRQGYRVQVFSDGRNQSSLQARAKARGNAVASRFPKYRGQVYTFSSSPNWFTRVGNFETQSEANAALVELKRAFPSFANEMRVVKCQITLIK